MGQRAKDVWGGGFWVSYHNARALGEKQDTRAGEGKRERSKGTVDLRPSQEIPPSAFQLEVGKDGAGCRTARGRAKRGEQNPGRLADWQRVTGKPGKHAQRRVSALIGPAVGEIWCLRLVYSIPSGWLFPRTSSD